MNATAEVARTERRDKAGRSRRISIWRRIFGVDLRSLALMRIGLGVLLLVDLLQRSGDLKAHYSDYGVMPRTLLADRVTDSPWCLSVHMMSGAVPVEAVLFLIAALGGFCLLIGWRTRLATIVSWFLLMSLHYRNPMILQGGDVLFRMLLFFGMFLPLGACWSVDAFVRRETIEKPTSFFSVATIALLLQVAFMYNFSVLLKNDPVWWSDFSAVHDALSVTHFVRPLGLWLLPHTELLKQLTIGTLVLETLAAPVALLGGAIAWPVRVLVIVAVAAFHATMGLTMQLGLFSFICWTAWTPFLPSGFWDFVERRRPQRLPGRAGIIWLRSWLAQFAQRLPRWRADSPLLSYSLRPSTANQFIALFFISYIFLWNVRTTNAEKFSSILPNSLNWIAWTTGVCQVWDMFSPAPLSETGWFIMPAQLADGSEVDLWRNGAPVTWERPRLISAMYKNDRWRKYMVLFAAASNSDRRLPFAQWLAARWNDNHPPTRQILTFQIYLMMQRTLPDTQVDTPHPLLLWMHDCRAPENLR